MACITPRVRQAPESLIFVTDQSSWRHRRLLVEIWQQCSLVWVFHTIQTWVELKVEDEETYGVEQVYRLILMDRKKAPLSCRCSLENWIKFKIITPWEFPNNLREQMTLLSWWTRALEHDSVLQEVLAERNGKMTIYVISGITSVQKRTESSWPGRRWRLTRRNVILFLSLTRLLRGSIG